MKFTEYTEKLNNSSIALARNGQVPFVFCCGNSVVQIMKIAHDVCPFGKILFINSDKTYLATRKHEQTFLDGNFKPVFIKLNPKNCYDIKSISEIFTCDDEIRLVVVTDGELAQAGYYFASVRNLPCVTVYNSAKVEGALNYNAYIDCGKGVQGIRITCPRYIVFDFEKLTESANSKSELYAYVLSKIVALVDYRLYCEVKRIKPSVDGYETVKEAVNRAFKIFSVKEERQFAELIYDAVSVEMGVYYSQDEITFVSAPKITASLYTGKIFWNAKEEFFAAMKIINIYSMVFSKKYDGILEIPDYVKRAEELFEITKSNADYYVGLEKGVLGYNLHAKDLEKLKDVLIKEADSFANIFKTLYNTYLALGGTEYVYDEKFAKSIKLSGDLPEVFNGMSLARESGVSEFL